MVAFAVAGLLISHPKAKFLVRGMPFLAIFYSSILHVPQRVSPILQQSDITEFVHVTHLGHEKHMFVTKKKCKQ